MTLQAGADTAQPFGYSGTIRDCTAADPGVTPTSAIWDGFGFCPADCAVTVDPGQEMTLTSQHWNPQVHLWASFRQQGGDETRGAHLTLVGDGRYRTQATNTPGDWVLTVGARSPGETGTWGFDVHVRHAGLESLEANRALWEEHGPAGYRFTAELAWDWGSEGPFEIFVDGDAVVEVSPVGVDSVPGRRFGDVGWLFELVASIPPAHLREVVYDPILGYPTLVMGAGPSHEEWALRAEGLVAAGDEPPAAPATTLDLPWLSRGHIQQVDAIVAGAVSDAVRTSFDDPGWVVTFHPQSSFNTERGLFILDPLLPAQLPILWDRGGENLVLFLADEPLPLGERPTFAPDYRVLWAARRTDTGLQFVGPADAVPFLNAEVPRLCTSAADRTASSPATLAGADDQLTVLTEWLRRLEMFRANHGTDATAAQAEERLARVCRDLGLAQ
ncbi:MAG: hypothetical protein JW785_00505 [Acidimicrobiia bacterium]|nr:hypothetical protein [Acidimicrobiia bacterium]